MSVSIPADVSLKASSIAAASARISTACNRSATTAGLEQALSEMHKMRGEARRLARQMRGLLDASRADDRVCAERVQSREELGILLVGGAA